ncbi:MAG TPA: hypothetical protein VHU19_18490 [Pyrinomonadaceae bacterium]|jgi:hypothetical protein|nr:hypothetical protein [Pyrinomonadaceae bacterium]
MIDFKKILEPGNRVILLDVIIFLVNLILMTILARLFADLTHAVKSDTGAKMMVIVFCLALCILSPVGAMLKRRGAHQRNPELGADNIGCLWLPYFLSQLMFWIFAGVLYAELLEQISGDENASKGLFMPLFLGIPLVAIFNTLIFFFYFLKPKHEPVFKFLRWPQAESLGDIFLFTNLIGYQVLWLYLMTELPKDHSGIFDRLFTFVFTAVFVYLPPRLFYVVENRERPQMWLLMLLSNSPIILRLLLS